jgi:predicted dehydrogenase
MRQLTVAVVGLGYGRAHIPAFQAHDCSVVAVCQRDQAAATTVAKAYGIPNVFARWQDMLAGTSPDVVVIATPPRLHREIALAAFARGAHVVCEKPLAMTSAEAAEMTAAARQAGRLALTGFNWRFPAAMQRFRAMAREGVLGRIFHINGRWVNGRWADAATPGTWRMDLAEAGHGAMGDQGVHLVDLVQWAFGPIARVCALAGVAYPSRTAPGAAGPADAEDYCAVLGELASGAQITLRVSRTSHGINEHALDASGADGTLTYRMGRDSSRWYDGEVRFASAGGALQAVPVEVGPAVTDKDPSDVIGKATLAPLVANLLRAIETGTPPSPSFEDGLRAQTVLDAVLESSRRRAWVDVRREPAAG